MTADLNPDDVIVQKPRRANVMAQRQSTGLKVYRAAMAEKDYVTAIKAATDLLNHTGQHSALRQGRLKRMLVAAQEQRRIEQALAKKSLA